MAIDMLVNPFTLPNLVPLILTERQAPMGDPSA